MRAHTLQIATKCNINNIRSDVDGRAAGTRAHSHDPPTSARTHARAGSRTAAARAHRALARPNCCGDDAIVARVRNNNNNT